MTVVLVFAITLLVGVLTSALAQRSVLSTAVLFLVAGFVAGEGWLHILTFRPDSPAVVWLAQLALFSVLFTDAMQVSLKEPSGSWRLAGRALIVGLPLTIGSIGLLARYLAGFSWVESFLLGAVLAPTDPVFVAAIVGREEVPKRLRDLLNLESGLNDGLALPVVLVLLGMANQRQIGVGVPIFEAAFGILAGIAIPWAVLRLERTRFFEASQLYAPLLAFSVGLTVLAVTFMTGLNEFLAAFAAGVTVANVSPEARDAFHRFGEILTELLKLAAVLIFGSLISIPFLTRVSAAGYGFIFLALIAARPFALAIALAGSGLPWREWVAAAWFGPKGFSSVTYALFILTSAAEHRFAVYHLAALVIASSMIAHSSTDVLVARWFCRSEEKEGDPGQASERTYPPE